MNALAPWNWFKREDAGERLPIHRSHGRLGYGHPLADFRRNFDTMFDELFASVGTRHGNGTRLSLVDDVVLRPKLDIDATDDAYTISVELPGVEQDDVSVELVDDTLVIRGEKQHVREESGTTYCVERTYGAFQRQLSLPADANGDAIEARFKDGVMTIRVPRAEGSQLRSKEISVHAN